MEPKARQPQQSNPREPFANPFVCTVGRGLISTSLPRTGSDGAMKLRLQAPFFSVLLQISPQFANCYEEVTSGDLDRMVIAPKFELLGISE